MPTSSPFILSHRRARAHIIIATLGWTIIVLAIAEYGWSFFAIEILGYGAIWLTGLIGIFLSYRNLNLAVTERETLPPARIQVKCTCAPNSAPPPRNPIASNRCAASATASHDANHPRLPRVVDTRWMMGRSARYDLGAGGGQRDVRIEIVGQSKHRSAAWQADAFYGYPKEKPCILSTMG